MADREELEIDRFLKVKVCKKLEDADVDSIAVANCKTPASGRNTIKIPNISTAFRK